jgi:hypothetical protein
VKVQLRHDWAEFEFLEAVPPDTYREEDVPIVDIDNEVIKTFEKAWETLFEAKRALDKAYHFALDTKAERERSERAIVRLLKGRTIDEAFPICCERRY